MAAACRGRRSLPRGAHEAAHREVSKQRANSDVGVHPHRVARVRRCMKPRPRLPCSRSRCEGDKRKEYSCHLQPHDARKSHNRREQRTLRLFSCRLHRPNIGDASGSGRSLPSRRHGHPAWRIRRTTVGRIRDTRGLRRLHQRLRSVPSAVSQGPSELHPIHANSLRAGTLLWSQNELATPDIQGPVREISKRMKTMFWVAGAVCGAVAGLMIWNRQRDEPVEDLAHRLESAWADHHTVV